MTPEHDILCFATKGAGSNEEDRIRLLLADLQPRMWAFDRSNKLGSTLRLAGELVRRRPRLVVMEGTGIAGGLVLLLANLVLGIPFVVSSGDAVGPFLGLRSWALRPIGTLYERLLCMRCAGFIGWTPYLVGRAITFGAPRGMTAANWSIHGEDSAARPEVRAELGLDECTIVFGLIGALVWVQRRDYCYGLELIRALRRTDREDLAVVVIGEGTGIERLREAAGDELGKRVLLPGPVAYDAVPRYLSTFDVASLPQSIDEVGALRYTTKLSEYLAAGLPVVTGQLPFAYDLDDGWLWRLPGDAPWDERYVDSLAELMGSLTRSEIDEHRDNVPTASRTFDPERQRRRAGAFVRDILAGLDRSERVKR